MDSPVVLSAILVFIDDLSNEIDRVFLVQFTHSSLIGPNAIFEYRRCRPPAPTEIQAVASRWRINSNALSMRRRQASLPTR